MKCQKFESQLELFLAEKLPSASMHECRAHLESCFACRDLLNLARKELVWTEPAQGEKLVQAVLGKTIDKSCSQAHELLPDHVDGILAERQRLLLEQHLEHCASCHQILQTLIELKIELPNLAEMDPGRNFSWRVIQATRQLDRLTPHGRFRFKQAWHRLLYRPRLAWEAAYTLTLLLFALSKLLTFIPGWPSVESISSLQAKPAQIWKTTASRVEKDLVKYSMSMAVNQDRWMRASSGSKDELSKTMVVMAQKTGQYWKSASIAVIQMQNSIWNGITSQIDDVWLKGASGSQRLSPKKETN